MSTVPHVEQHSQIPNGRPVQAPPPPPQYTPPRIDVFTFLSLALRALSGHALKWAGLLLSFVLFAWIVASPTIAPVGAKLGAAGCFGFMVLVLWIRKGER